MSAIKTLDCGCEVVVASNGSVMLTYCSKHKAVDDLYEACMFAEYMLRNKTYNHKQERDKALELLKRALAKVKK